MKMKESAYKEAGVDIEAGAEVINRIRPLVHSTFRNGVMGDLGGFGAFFDLKQTNYKDPVLVSATDGVGTKIKIAIDTNQHHTIGIDLVAMCVNDLVVQGAEPLFFLDYFACGKLDPAMTEQVIAGVAEGCKQAGCALIGGETAEMPGLYSEGDYDLAGFAVGAVERDNIIKGDRIGKGDIVLGIASSGAHSNGYSLIRRLVETTQGFSWDSPAPFQPDATMGEAFLTPTRIYVRSLLKALKEEDTEGKPVIRAMAHITGGGLTENIPRVLPASLAVTLDANLWPFPSLFKWLRDVGELEAGDMAQTLNCGIGMVVICHREGADRVKACLKDEGETVYVIGAVVENDGTSPVRIENMTQAWKWKS